jgi:hypothetical protein
VAESGTDERRYCYCYCPVTVDSNRAGYQIIQNMWRNLEQMNNVIVIVIVPVTVDSNRTGYQIIQNMLRNLKQMFYVII